MRIEQYAELAMRTSDDAHDRVLNGCLGLISESGEAIDVVKKRLFGGLTDDKAFFEALIEELGDVLWYAAELCRGLGIDMARAVHQMRRKRKRPACGTLYHDAWQLSERCRDPYDTYYRDGAFKRPTILRAVKNEKGRVMRIIDTRETAPIIYPAEFSSAPSVVTADVTAIDIAEIALSIEAIIERYTMESLSFAMERNIEKIKGRHPDRF